METTMDVDPAALGVILAVMLASAVEFVEALTIVLAMGVARSWRSTLVGTGLALALLAVVTVVIGSAIGTVISESALQLTIGTLLLIFGLQWLRKAVLRASGLKALHDEDAIYREEQEAARAAGETRRFGLDWYAFVISFKGVFLEGLEVVFIVITFGRNAGNIPLAATGAAISAAIVLTVGAFAHKPLSNVPENALKFAVGLLLATFGVFWVGEGVGAFGPEAASLEWPGGDAALVVLLAAWSAASYLAVRALKPLASTSSDTRVEAAA